MKIKPLTSVPFEEVISCFLNAFNDYYVKLPEDTAYWRSQVFVTRENWEFDQLNSTFLEPLQELHLYRRDSLAMMVSPPHPVQFQLRQIHSNRAIDPS